MLQLSGELYCSSPGGISALKYLQMCISQVVYPLSLFVPLKGTGDKNRQGKSKHIRLIAEEALQSIFLTAHKLSFVCIDGTLILLHSSTLHAMEHLCDIQDNFFLFSIKEMQSALSEMKIHVWRYLTI